ncbi:DUF4924 family protein [Roseivirga sp. BDSF3-8]|uniref:DUF4924 family protein n=1 Tax=Roseivirga sp. BDSF3-8 TaxID=3241598 RepID=UPI003531F63F
MVPAEHKKKENISEYVLYLLHAQDVIREAGFDSGKIKQYVEEHVPKEDGDKDAILSWYQNIASQMKEEGKEKEGFIQLLKEHMDSLADLNKELLRSDQEYRRNFDQAKLHINRRLNEMNGEVRNPVEVCVVSVYEVNKMRHQGQQPEEELASAVFAFQNLLSYLSYRYRQRNKS